jgi:hypothetical protein
MHAKSDNLERRLLGIFLAVAVGVFSLVILTIYRTYLS